MQAFLEQTERVDTEKLSGKEPTKLGKTEPDVSILKADPIEPKLNNQIQTEDSDSSHEEIYDGDVIRTAGSATFDAKSKYIGSNNGDLRSKPDIVTPADWRYDKSSPDKDGAPVLDTKDVPSLPEADDPDHSGNIIEKADGLPELSNNKGAWNETDSLCDSLYYTAPFPGITEEVSTEKDDGGQSVATESSDTVLVETPLPAVNSHAVRESATEPGVRGNALGKEVDANKESSTPAPEGFEDSCVITIFTDGDDGNQPVSFQPSLSNPDLKATVEQSGTRSKTPEGLTRTEKAKSSPNPLDCIRKVYRAETSGSEINKELDIRFYDSPAVAIFQSDVKDINEFNALILYEVSLTGSAKLPYNTNEDIGIGFPITLSKFKNDDVCRFKCRAEQPFSDNPSLSQPAPVRCYDLKTIARFLVI